MFFLRKTNESARLKNTSFKDWANKNNAFIIEGLIGQGVAFITEHAEKLKSPLTQLITDNRWHYLDKPKKESYRATLDTDHQGVPRLNLTYYTFRDGGRTNRFDSKAALKELWKQALDGGIKPLAPVQPQPVEPVPSTKKDTLPVIDYLARDLERWNTLNLNGQCDYLARKG